MTDTALAADPPATDRPGDPSIAYWIGHLAATIVALRTMDSHRLVDAIDQLGTRRQDDPAVLTAGSRYIEWEFDDRSSADGLFAEQAGVLRLRRMTFRQPDGAGFGSPIVEVVAPAE